MNEGITLSGLSNNQKYAELMLWGISLATKSVIVCILDDRNRLYKETGGKTFDLSNFVFFVFSKAILN